MTAKENAIGSNVNVMIDAATSALIENAIHVVQEHQNVRKETGGVARENVRSADDQSKLNCDETAQPVRND